VPHDADFHCTVSLAVADMEDLIDAEAGNVLPC
jgi:hypothetical protein